MGKTSLEHPGDDLQIAVAMDPEPSAAGDTVVVEHEREHVERDPERIASVDASLLPSEPLAAEQAASRSLDDLSSGPEEIDRFPVVGSAFVTGEQRARSSGEAQRPCAARRLGALGEARDRVLGCLAINARPPRPGWGC